MLHLQHSLCSFTDSCKCLRQKIIKSLSVCQSLFKNTGVVAQLLIRKLSHLGPQRLNLVHNRINHLEFPLAVGAK